MNRIRVDFVISRVLAIALPLMALGYGIDQLVSTKTRNARRQIENAGMLLNGEVLKVPVTQAIHKRMITNPNLVLIGNSFANTNIQVAQLGGEVGMGKGHAARLSIPNTIGAHWYALLAHRVFQPQYQAPDVIVIVSDLQSALLNQPLSEGSYRNLLSLLHDEDPVIDARVERSNSLLWEVISENRAKFRRNTVNTVREASARRVLSEVPRGKVRRLTNDAMDRVFHASRMDPTLRAGGLPVTVGEETAQIDLSALPSAAESFLPEIARLCHENGARLVMVRNKESPLMPPGQGDLVPEGTVDEVREAISAWGGVLIDMDPVPMVAADYDNLDHMTPDGSRRFTRALAEALVDIGIADDRENYVRPLSPASIVLPEATSTTPLESIRRSWHALDSGATARWAWDEAWPGPAGTFRVRGLFEPLGPGEPPAMRVNGVDARVLELPSGRWIAQLSAPPPSAQWELTIEADAPVLIEGIEVGTGSTPLYLSGYRPDVRGHRLELLGRIEVFDGELYRDAVKPVVPRTAPLLQRVTNLHRGPGPSVSIETPNLAQLSDTRTRKITTLQARCSPLRMRENGIELLHPNVGCKEVRELGKGRMCHSGRRIFFSASDTTQPMRNGRAYELFLDPERACDGGFWMYPGDVMRVPVPPARLRELRDGVRELALDLGISQIPEPPFLITLIVEVNGAEHSRFDLDAATVRTPFRLPVDPPIAPDDSVELVFENITGESWLIVNRVALVPPPIVWESFTPQAP